MFYHFFLHLDAKKFCSYLHLKSQLFLEPFSRTNTAHSMHNEMLFDSIRKAFEEDYEKLSETRDLDAFLDVKPIAPLPFILARSV